MEKNFQLTIWWSIFVLLFFRACGRSKWANLTGSSCWRIGCNTYLPCDFWRIKWLEININLGQKYLCLVTDLWKYIWKTRKIQTNTLFLDLSFRILNIHNYYLQSEHCYFKVCTFSWSPYWLGHLNLILWNFNIKWLLHSEMVFPNK